MFLYERRVQHYEKNTKKLLSLLLAVTMVFGMNTFAFADEAEAGVAEVREENASVASGGIVASDNSGFMLDENGNIITSITFESDGKKKKASNSVAVIKNVTDPVSWNNIYGRDLMNTILISGDMSDEVLNFGKKLGVSANNHYEDVDGKMSAPDGLLPAALGQQFRVFTVDKNEKIYLIMTYYMFNGEAVTFAYAKGRDGYAGADLAPLPREKEEKPFNDDYESEYLSEWLERVETIPFTTWDGRKIKYDKDGYYAATKSKKENLYVRVSLIQYSGNSVTELYGTRVNKIKFSKEGMDKASISTREIPAVVEVKYIDTEGKEQTIKTNKMIDFIGTGEDGIARQPFYESEVIGTLPYFTLTVKTDKKLKKYKDAINKALEGQKFEFGIMQAGAIVEDPLYDILGTGEKPILDEYVTNGEGRHWSIDLGDGKEVKNEVKVIPASDNDAEKSLSDEIEKKVGGKAAAVELAYYDSLEIANIGGLFFRKFDGKKAKILQMLPIYKKGKHIKDEYRELSAKDDYELKEGTLAGGEKVKVLELKGNYDYSCLTPYEIDALDKDGYLVKKGETKLDDLSAFGFKWAFRVSPKNKKASRIGIYADKDVGFVMGK